MSGAERCSTGSRRRRRTSSATCSSRSTRRAGSGSAAGTEIVAPIEALGRAHLRRQVADPVLREKLTPRYRFGCKRPILSNSVLPGAHARECRRDHGADRRVNRRSITTADGVRHPVDTIITATGYRYNRSLLVERLTGLGDRSLGEVWDRSPRAYLGASVPGFPNMFILLGPNAIGINSVIYTLESQIGYVMGALRTMERRRVRRSRCVPRHSTRTSMRSTAAAPGRCGRTAAAPRTTSTTPGATTRCIPDSPPGSAERTRRFDPRAYELRVA